MCGDCRACLPDVWVYADINCNAPGTKWACLQNLCTTKANALPCSCLSAEGANDNQKAGTAFAESPPAESSSATFICLCTFQKCPHTGVLLPTQ